MRSFLSNSSLKTILFDWVLHEQSIWDDLLSRLPLAGVEVVEVALTCSPDCLRQHFAADGRDMARVEASIARLPLYQKLRAHKLDVTGLSPEQSAQRLLAWLRQRG